MDKNFEIINWQFFIFQTFFKFEGFGKEPHHVILPNSKYTVTVQSLPMYVGENNQVNIFNEIDVVSPS